MKLNNSQRGMTFWSTVFILFIIGFAVLVVLKLSPVYMEDMSIQSALESVKQNAAADQHHTANSVRIAIRKRLQVDNVDAINTKDIHVDRQGNLFVVDIKYQVIVPFIGNISLLVNFDHSASVLAGS